MCFKMSDLPEPAGPVKNTLCPCFTKARTRSWSGEREGEASGLFLGMKEEEEGRGGVLSEVETHSPLHWPLPPPAKEAGKRAGKASRFG
ncbi:hypothetical protein C7212DRAFT_221309 [Tuber magnatum]|uniref:Uncharacterized protein n=1 Tax=Tuber magnatum TaxID=42249 RepID=A0A317SFW0_9PEZI|nr:hypothetical protein C7212DRAFT_221309 [Tuber magnatum]